MYVHNGGHHHPSTPPPQLYLAVKQVVLMDAVICMIFSGIRVYLELISTSPVGRISLAVRG